MTPLAGGGKPVVLIILDGVGLNPSSVDNGFALARTPSIDHLFSSWPTTELKASAEAVGLPSGQMGNSEVGHLTLGCGAVPLQDRVRLDRSIDSGDFFTNPTLVRTLAEVKDAGRPLHLLGLVSDGGVHSLGDHLLAALELCRREGVRPLVHMITDGRDSGWRSAPLHVERILVEIDRCRGVLASICGRYWAMDRDRRWQRTQRAWSLLVEGEGEPVADAIPAIQQGWKRDGGDEFLQPLRLPGFAPVEEGDRVLMFNFRADRVRQLASALGDPEFSGFDRGGRGLAHLVTLCDYGLGDWIKGVVLPSYSPEVTLAETLSRAGIPQFHCSESEKYAHVTYFFNGGREEPWAGEERILVPSPRVATYDLCPEMSAAAIADAAIGAIAEKKYGFVVLNFANGDMVGHTGVRAAVVKAVEAADAACGRVLEAALDGGYAVLVTADHGNCELMVDPADGEPHTRHTVFPVPCAVAGSDKDLRLLTGCGLSSVAPTVLDLMGREIPAAMTGPSLLSHSRPRPEDAQ